MGNANVEQSEFDLTDETTLTVAGSLRIVKSGDDHEIRLNGKTAERIHGANSVNVAGQYPPGSRPSVILLAVNSGGTGCPAMFRVLNLRGSSHPHITGEFGNCSDIPEAHWNNGYLRLKFPKFRQAKAVVWMFQSNTNELIREN